MIAKLDAAVKAAAPIFGVSVGNKSDKATWRIFFKPEATDPQRSAAQGVVDAFDVEAAENPSADELAGIAVDRMDRLQFEVSFDHENRIRAREGKGAITRAQFRDALIARWKSF